MAWGLEVSTDFAEWWSGRLIIETPSPRAAGGSGKWMIERVRDREERSSVVTAASAYSFDCFVRGAIAALKVIVEDSDHFLCDGRSRRIWRLTVPDEGLQFQATPNASHGYLYCCAFRLPSPGDGADPERRK